MKSQNNIRVSLVSLGCPKNLVDSEEMVGALVAAGYEMVTDTSEADVVVVNTCGFIESAKEESIGAIIDAIEKKTGGCKSVIVAGCLAQRYAKDLAEEMPEVNAFLGVGQNNELPKIVAETLAGQRFVESCNSGKSNWVSGSNRVRSTAPWTAYLRIAEGCDNRCAYCAIPDIRGSFNSRPPEMIIAEAKKMASEGVREINVIAQDITRYGQDIDGWSLERLLRELVKIDGLFWIRLMYCYPTRITDGLIEVIATEPKICKYMDIPLQHGDDKVLAAMNRRGSRNEYLKVVKKLRDACPEIALRTSFIVGFPGEGDAEFESLLSFIEEIDFDRVGAFTYSKEDGTPAASFTDQVPEKIAKKRLNRLMQLAQKQSLEHNKKLLGKTIDVLVESPGVGRSYRDAPEIDGIVRLIGGDARPGEIVQATVVDVGEYDLTARCS